MWRLQISIQAPLKQLNETKYLKQTKHLKQAKQFKGAEHLKPQSKHLQWVRARQASKATHAPQVIKAPQ